MRRGINLRRLLLRIKVIFGNKLVLGCSPNRRVDNQRMLKKEIEHYKQKEKDVAESKLWPSSVPFDIQC